MASRIYDVDYYSKMFEKELIELKNLKETNEKRFYIFAYCASKKSQNLEDEVVEKIIKMVMNKWNLFIFFFVV